MQGFVIPVTVLTPGSGTNLLKPLLACGVKL